MLSFIILNTFWRASSDKTKVVHEEKIQQATYWIQQLCGQGVDQQTIMYLVTMI
jgi:hypothetical protein